MKNIHGLFLLLGLFFIPVDRVKGNLPEEQSVRFVNETDVAVMVLFKLSGLPDRELQQFSLEPGEALERSSEELGLSYDRRGFEIRFFWVIFGERLGGQVPPTRYFREVGRELESLTIKKDLRLGLDPRRAPTIIDDSYRQNNNEPQPLWFLSPELVRLP